MVRLLWVVLSVGKVEFGVRMGGMVVWVVFSRVG